MEIKSEGEYFDIRFPEFTDKFDKFLYFLGLFVLFGVLVLGIIILFS